RTLHIKNDVVAFNLVFDCFHYVHSDTSRTLNRYQTGCGLLAKRSQILHRIAIAYHAARETPTPSLPQQIPLSPRLALPYLHALRKGITVINPVISVPRSIQCTVIRNVCRSQFLPIVLRSNRQPMLPFCVVTEEKKMADQPLMNTYGRIPLACERGE